MKHPLVVNIMEGAFSNCRNLDSSLCFYEEFFVVNPVMILKIKPIAMDFYNSLLYYVVQLHQVQEWLSDHMFNPQPSNHVFCINQKLSFMFVFVFFWGGSFPRSNVLTV